MTKWLGFFLLVITTTATFYPCCSQDGCTEMEQTSKGSNRAPEGTCSPFVSCNTCCGFIQSAKIIEIPLIAPEKPMWHLKSTSFTPTTYTAPLFQPPRLRSRLVFAS